MSEDYEWDRSGTPDAQIVELEQTLSALSFEPVAELPWPESPESPESGGPATRPSGHASGPRGMATAAIVSAAAALVVIWLAADRGSGSPVVRSDSTSGASETVVQRVAEPTPDPSDSDPSVAELEGPRVAPGDGEVSVARSASESESDPTPIASERGHASKSPSPPSGRGSRALRDAEELSVDCILDPRKCAGAPKAASSSSRARSGKSPKSKGSSRKSSKNPDVSVDCVLDPSACRRPSSRDKLSSSDIRDGMRPVRPRIQACGRKFDVEPRTMVRVKFLVQGRSGKISKATALAPWTGTELGECVAEAAATAVFPRFDTPELGVVYPFRLGRSKSEGSDDEALPNTLSSAQIRAAIRPARAEMNTCGIVHDAEKGRRLQVKLTIEGATGAVTKARVEVESAGLRQCLEKAARGVKFPRFAKPSLTVRYPITM